MKRSFNYIIVVKNALRYYVHFTYTYITYLTYLELSCLLLKCNNQFKTNTAQHNTDNITQQRNTQYKST